MTTNVSEHYLKSQIASDLGFESKPTGQSVNKGNMFLSLILTLFHFCKRQNSSLNNQHNYSSKPDLTSITYTIQSKLFPKTEDMISNWACSMSTTLTSITLPHLNI